MKTLPYFLIVICSILLISSSCQRKAVKSHDNKIFYQNHAYDIIKLNDTTFMSIPTGMMDADTVKCQIFKL